ncbi:thiosulfate sulfurtransferase GlpE [Pasteurella oralis]|uniref:thiosulfate sulfurtransferase GlpE n=1 Tax=Pasteurella oralis TaxID=1071947 RepID=UPI000C7CA9C8|nr:thiosulfate sulfurtransferase GlpE [Pasteurella oralis]
MSQFAELSPQQAWQLMQQRDAALLDIRNPLHFAAAHPQHAFHLTNQSYGQFELEYDDDHPVIVICYHGISSRGAAMYLIEQGYTEVYSVTGGFEAWQREGLPIESMA